VEENNNPHAVVPFTTGADRGADSLAAKTSMLACVDGDLAELRESQSPSGPVREDDACKLSGGALEVMHAEGPSPQTGTARAVQTPLTALALQSRLRKMLAGAGGFPAGSGEPAAASEVTNELVILTVEAVKAVFNDTSVVRPKGVKRLKEKTFTWLIDDTHGAPFSDADVAKAAGARLLTAASAAAAEEGRIRATHATRLARCEKDAQRLRVVADELIALVEHGAKTCSSYAPASGPVCGKRQRDEEADAITPRRCCSCCHPRCRQPRPHPLPNPP